jgi:hypothetical protein
VIDDCGLNNRQLSAISSQQEKIGLDTMTRYCLFLAREAQMRPPEPLA